MDMIVDVRTVVFVSLSAFALMAIFLGWSWRTQRLGDALGWWSAAFGFATVDALLLFIAPPIEPPFSWIDEAVFLLAAFTIWFGFRSLDGRSLPVALALATITVFAAAAVVLDLSPRLTHVVSITIAVSIIALMARDVFRRNDGGRSWRVAAMAIIGVHGSILVARTLLDDGTVDGTVITVENARTALFMLEPVLLPMALGYVFLGLAYDRQHRDTVAETECDPLTGVLNRRGLDRWAERSTSGGLAVVMADIDHFKSVNDAFGHDAGDRVLIAVAERLQSEVRAGDAIARLGGEEFCVVMTASPTAALDAAERMRRAVAASPIETSAGAVAVTMSFGVAMADGRGEALSSALKAADMALYDAKRGGRDRVAAAPEEAGAAAPAVALSSST